MGTELYRSLNYGHYDINRLLKKIDDHFVLTEKEYKQLLKDADYLSRISTFDGSYDSLKGLPNIHEIAHVIAMNRDTALQNELKTLIEQGDQAVTDELSVQLADLHELLIELQDGLITLDEEVTVELQKEINEALSFVAELENKVNDFESKKSDVGHQHKAEEIEDLNTKFEDFKFELNETYLLDDVNSKRHTHAQGIELLDTITKDKINEWNNKLNQDQLDELQNQLELMELDYISRDAVIEEVIAKIPDPTLFVLEKDLYSLLSQRAYAVHTHKISEIINLIEALNKKVDKETGKTLIEGTLITKLEILLKKHAMEKDEEGKHLHLNLDSLDLITDELIEQWSAGVSAETVKEIIIDLLEENDLTGLENRLNGLSFIPIKHDDFNKLSDEEKTDPTKVYIINDMGSDEVECLENYMTKEQVDLIVNTLLEKRLDGLQLKQVTSEEYNDITEQEEGVLYVITDAIDIDMNVYLTKENLEERISEPATSDNRPASPALGQCYFDTTLGKPIWFDGANWVDALGSKV